MNLIACADIIIVDGNDNPIEFTQEGIVEGMMGSTSIVRYVADGVDLIWAALDTDNNECELYHDVDGNIELEESTISGIEYISQKFIQIVSKDIIERR